MDAFRRLNMQSTTTKNSPASSIFQIILTSKVVAIFLAILMVGTLLFSIYMDERSVGLLRQEAATAAIQRHPLDVYEVDTCPMYIFPYGHPFSNLKHVHLDDVPYFPQFAWVDITDNQIYLQCDGEISILGPDSSQFLTPQNKWIHIRRSQLEAPKEPPANPSLNRPHITYAHKVIFTNRPILSKIYRWYVWLRSSSNSYSMKTWHLPWKVIANAFHHESHNITTPIPLPAYIWIICDKFSEANVILRPPLYSNVIHNTLSKDSPRLGLSQEHRDELNAYMYYLSAPVSDPIPRASIAKSLTTSSIKDMIIPMQISEQQSNKEKYNLDLKNWKPKLNTILVIYLDAVSKVKFDYYFKQTKTILNEMSSLSQSKYTHNSIELKLLHSLGQNSHVNYPQYFSGISRDERVFLHKQSNNQYDNFWYNTSTQLKTNPLIMKNMREPWLFDIAEILHYKTFQSETGICSNYCHDQCYDKSEHDAYYYEVGGYTLQYMLDTKNRLPSESVFYHSMNCEIRNRKILYPYSGHQYKHTKYDSSMWVGDKLSQSYGYDWLRHWLYINKQQSRFGVMVSEETHGDYFIEQNDQELAQLLEDLFLNKHSDNISFNMSNAGIIIMADHGLHFKSEFETMPGRMANKNPFGYVLLPTQYVNTHPEEYQRLLYNAQQMTTAYDLRATTLYWMTGREWSSKAMKQKLQTMKDKEEQEKLQLMIKRVYATQYGINLLTEMINPVLRNCNNAGIPSDFCGCHLAPCQSKMFPLVHKHHTRIVQMINNKLNTDNSEVLSVCKPLKMEEVTILVPLQETVKQRGECLSNNDSMLISVHIHRGSGYLVSVTLGVDSIHHEPTDEFKDIFMVSLFQPTWDQCSSRLKAINVSDSIFYSLNGQFCFCLDR